MNRSDIILETGVNDEVNIEDDDDVDEDDDDKSVNKYIHLPCLLDAVQDPAGDLSNSHLFLDDSCYSAQPSNIVTDTWNLPVEPTSSVSLIVADEANTERLKQVISPCLVDHELYTCTYDDVYENCCKTAYYMVWFYLGNPIKQDVLALTTSIRYATKTSRDTIIVGVTPTQLTADIGLVDLAEIVVEPITKPYIYTKYRRWASLTIREKVFKDNTGEETSSTTLKSLSTDMINNNTCVDNSVVTNSPAKSCSSLDNTNNNCISSSFVSPVPEPKTTRKNMVGPKHETSRPRSRTKHNTMTSEEQRLSKQLMAADHTTKEKMRRERIKDSCDQLRVLLPYIRGRKTDMASILEMTVDYLKLITSSLPADFQSQIIATMAAGSYDEVNSKSNSSRGSSISSRRSSRSKDPGSPSFSKVTSSSDISLDSSHLQDLDVDINGNITGANANKTSQQVSSPVSYNNLKRTDSMDTSETKPAKRMMMSSPAGITSAPSNMLYIKTDEGNDCGRSLDNSHEDMFQGHIQSMRIPQTHWTDMYSVSSYPQLADTSNPRVPSRERDSYGVFMDSYYHYYTGQQSGGYGTNPISDYVNPNAVLPMSYSMRMPENCSYDDRERFSGSASVENGYANQT